MRAACSPMRGRGCASACHGRGRLPAASPCTLCGPIRRGSVDGTLSVRLAAPVRSAQSNEIRYSRLKTLKARDDAMQEVKKQALAKLPSLTSGAGYAALLENLILEVRLTVRGRLRVRFIAPRLAPRPASHDQTHIKGERAGACRHLQGE